MSLEATSSQDLIQLVFKGGSLMLNVGKFGAAAPFKIAAYLQAKLDRATQNKKSGKIDMSMVGADGQPVSCFMLRYEDFLTVKDEAKRYGLKYGVIIDVNKPLPDDEVALFINQNDAVKLERILDSLKVAALESDLDSVKIEDEKANVIKAEVKLKEDDKDYSYEKAFGHKRKEEEDDPLEKTPSAETSTASEEKSKNPSVRKEIEKIRVEMEAEEKAEKMRNRNKKWKGKESADEAKVKSMRK